MRWFGRSSAPYQHFDQAAMRAIEKGRYLARAANTGISGIVDPYGRVLARTDSSCPRSSSTTSGSSATARSTPHRRPRARGLSLVLTAVALACATSPVPDTLGDTPMAIQLDEQFRRYQDLARRAADLRSYL